eukprot:gene3744-13804_t
MAERNRRREGKGDDTTDDTSNPMPAAPDTTDDTYNLAGPGPDAIPSNQDPQPAEPNNQRQAASSSRIASSRRRSNKVIPEPPPKSRVATARWAALANKLDQAVEKDWSQVTPALAPSLAGLAHLAHLAPSLVDLARQEVVVIFLTRWPSV